MVIRLFFVKVSVFSKDCNKGTPYSYMRTTSRSHVGEKLAIYNNVCACTGYIRTPTSRRVVCPRWRKWKISHAAAARACIHTCTCTYKCELVCTSIHGYVIRSLEAACWGIGEYQLPDLVVNLASRIIFGSVWRVRVFIGILTVGFW